MFQCVCEFLKTIEEIHPLPTHPSYFKEWYEDICVLWEANGEEVTKELNQILSYRKYIFDSSFRKDRKDRKDRKENTRKEAWKWLLTVEQMPQRTDDWYTQKKNMLTASEISNLWKGPRARINLMSAKCSNLEVPSKRLAVPRENTNPMDWGVRYEPIVKWILEKDTTSQIQELGRIQHRTIPGLAASPDGLYVSGPPEKVGCLLEIKCPISREIASDIPFDYWCQMQIQMEVCDIDACEYVEAKFKEEASASASASQEPKGYITLCIHTSSESDEMKYVYHDTPEPVLDANEPWLCLETYSWSCIKMRRTMVERDTRWFTKIQPDIALFWKEVEEVRNGTRILEPAKKKVKAIVEGAGAGAGAGGEVDTKYQFIDD